MIIALPKSISWDCVTSSLVLLAMFPTTFLSINIVTAVIIAKYLALIPMVVAEVLTVVEDAVEDEMVVGADEARERGGADYQPSLTLMPALT